MDTIHNYMTYEEYVALREYAMGRISRTKYAILDVENPMELAEVLGISYALHRDSLNIFWARILLADMYNQRKLDRDTGISEPWYRMYWGKPC